MPSARWAILVIVLAVLAPGCSALPPAAPPALAAEPPPAAVAVLAAPEAPVVVPVPEGQAAQAPLPPAPLVWGVLGMRGYFYGDQVAPNGLEFHPLFSLDTNLNLWLWGDAGVYVFSDTRFWGQKAAPGITNPSQGAFDFSKRELDFDLGLAWNYFGNLEARTFAYSANNLNRGDSLSRPSGYNDGVGLENRWYVGGTYPELGTPGFDVTRASFLSVGYYPTKDMVDADGNTFKPGPFARAYLVWDLVPARWYLYGDVEFLAEQSFAPKLLTADGGMAVRPFPGLGRLEFRLGSENLYDLQAHELETGLYGSVQLIF
jgi:hypothetical protein